MKKILLATTVLAMTSTLAAAEISFSGYGRFGLTYDDSRDVETQVDMRMRININGSVETDAGVKFGGRIRLQYDENSDGVVTGTVGFYYASGAKLSAAYLYAEMSGFRMEVGNANTAYDSAALMYNSEVGYLDRSQGDPNGDYYSFSSSPYEDQNGRMGIFASYSVGDLNARISYVDPDQTSTGDAEEISVSADYAFGAVTVAAAYVDNAAANEFAEALFLGAEYAFNDAGNVGVLYFDYDEDGSGSDSTRVTVYGNYTFGATTVAAYVANDDEDGLASETAYGLGVSYDLGGARAAFDVHSNYDEETLASVGVRFDF